MAFGLSALNGKRSLTTAEWQVGEVFIILYVIKCY